MTRMYKATQQIMYFIMHYLNILEVLYISVSNDKVLDLTNNRLS